MQVLSVSSPMHISAQLANVKKNGIQNSQMLYASDNVSFAAEPYRGIKEKRARLVMANIIIHGAAASAATISASMAQAPGSDEVPLTAVTTGMVGALMKGCYGIPVGTSICTSAAACAIGFRLGTGWWRHAVSWVPGIGNCVNSVTTFTLHEATGWAIVALCEKLLENGALNSNKKITIEDLKKMKAEAERLKKEGKNSSNNSVSFKGKENGLSTETNLINKFKELININDINANNNNDFAKLTSEICELYDIDFNSQAKAEMINYFVKLKQHLHENVVLINHPPVMMNDEELIDNSLELHYWLLLSLLEHKCKHGDDLNNIKITDSELANKNIQKQAVEYMKRAK